MQRLLPGLIVVAIALGFFAFRRPPAAVSSRASAPVTPRHRVLAAGSGYVVALDEQGRVSGWGGTQTSAGAQRLSTGERPREGLQGSWFQQVSAGDRGICALNGRGQLWRACEPWCLEAGPFPESTGAVKGSCDRCQDLLQAGLLSRRIVDDPAGGVVEYSLSAQGKAVYRDAPDPEYVQIVRARFVRQGEPRRRVDLEALARPRVCFGQTRFHSVTDAQSPMTIAGSSYIGVKLVAAATDTSTRLFDPQIARLALPVPPMPEPGKPAQYPARVMTFQVMAPDGSLEVSDMRYGAWVSEPQR